MGEGVWRIHQGANAAQQSRESARAWARTIFEIAPGRYGPGTATA